MHMELLLHHSDAADRREVIYKASKIILFPKAKTVAKSPKVKLTKVVKFKSGNQIQPSRLLKSQTKKVNHKFKVFLLNKLNNKSQSLKVNENNDLLIQSHSQNQY